MFNPYLLVPVEHSVKVYLFVQKAGQFLVTSPHSYQYAYNAGYNESYTVNYEPLSCINIGSVMALHK